MLNCKTKTALAANMILALSVAGFAQNSNSNSIAPVRPVSPVAPVAPVTFPQMPSFPSNPNQYKPGQKAKTTKTEPAPQETSAQSQNPQVAKTPVPNTSFTDQVKNLTATDLNALSQQGLFSDISSLLGANTSALTGVPQNQNVMLSQILNELSEIKAAQKNMQNFDAVKARPSNEPPAILRFVVNSQDILSSCSAVYFSNVESDGTFLLTGDCKTLYNNVTLSETFYILFRACGTKDGRNIYNVELTLSQGRENKNSALYRFCQQTDLQATKTGNLVTVRKVQNNFASDLLIDIGK